MSYSDSYRFLQSIISDGSSIEMINFSIDWKELALLPNRLNALYPENKKQDEKLIFFYTPSKKLRKTLMNFGGYAFGEIASGILYLGLQNPFQSVLYKDVILTGRASKDKDDRRNVIDKHLKVINKLIFEHSSLKNFLEKIKKGKGYFVYRINFEYASKIKLQPRKNFESFSE